MMSTFYVRSLNVLAEAIERKNAEAELRRSESQFLALFENALDAVLIANDLGAYVDANPAACALLGVPYDEIMGRTVHDFIDEDSTTEAWPIWEQFLKEGKMGGVIRLRRPDGEVVEVDFFRDGQLSSWSPLFGAAQCHRAPEAGRAAPPIAEARICRHVGRRDSARFQ
jgi:PAS domain S-box-containing protein